MWFSPRTLSQTHLRLGKGRPGLIHRSCLSPPNPQLYNFCARAILSLLLDDEAAEQDTPCGWLSF